MPVKRLSLTAAAGTTPFAVLFLAFSMFIIASALMLLAVLFKLGVDSRAAELGITLAVGFRRRLLRRMMLIEGGCVALAGALAGVLIGIAYAWLMLVGLKTWWLGAISTPFLELYVRPESLAIGYLCGVLVSLATIVWALRQTRRVSVRRLLAGQVEEARTLAHRHGGWARWIAAALAVAAVAIAIFGARLGGEAQAGAFFSAGALILAAGLIGVWQFLRNDSHWFVHRRSLGAIAIGHPQRRPASAAQHADDRPDGGGVLSDHRRQRLSARAPQPGTNVRQRRRRLWLDRPSRSADLSKSEFVRRPTRVRIFRGGNSNRQKRQTLSAPRASRRRCQLFESVSTAAAARAGCAAGIDRSRRVRLGGE